jgi:hypothetical protein
VWTSKTELAAQRESSNGDSSQWANCNELAFSCWQASEINENLAYRSCARNDGFAQDDAARDVKPNFANAMTAKRCQGAKKTVNSDTAFAVFASLCAFALKNGEASATGCIRAMRRRQFKVTVAVTRNIKCSR